MRSALRAKFGIAAALALAAGGVQAQGGRITGGGTTIDTVDGSIGQVGGASGRVGNAGQPLPAPGARTDGGIAGSPTRGGAGPRLQTIIPPSGPARNGLLGGESYERSGVPGRPRDNSAMTGVGVVNSYERTLEQAGDAATTVGASPGAFASGNAPGAAITGSGSDSTALPPGRSIAPMRPARPASGNADAQGSVTPGPGG